MSDYRPTGRLNPDPHELAQARIELAELQKQAQQGNLIWLYEDESIVWRFALPRAGWWHKEPRYRLPLHPLSRHQINQQERLKRQAWQPHRSWSRIRAGVLLSVVGAVQYGTSKVFWKATPHVDSYDFRQFIHPIMGHFDKDHVPVVMVADRSGIHRANALTSTLDHDQGRFRLKLLPARAGHKLNPIEGCWRVMKEALGAGRCFDDIQQLYQRTRRVLLNHQADPIYRFSWP